MGSATAQCDTEGWIDREVNHQYKFGSRLLHELRQHNTIPRNLHRTSIIMRTTISAVLAALLLGQVDAAGVTGKAFGFASGTTGGGSAAAATPSSLAQ